MHPNVLHHLTTEPGLRVEHVLPKIRFKRPAEGSNVIVPKTHTSGAAGFDLHAAERVDIWPGTAELVDTGLQVAIPKGWYGKLFDRSSTPKRKLTTLAGVVDHDYRGTVRIWLYNFGQGLVTVEIGDRLTQMVVMQCLTEFEVVDELDETERGDKGFGSTGQ